VTNVRRPTLVLVAVFAGWGTIPLLVRHVRLPAAAIVFSRLAIAALTLGLVLLVEHLRPAPVTDSHAAGRGAPSPAAAPTVTARPAPLFSARPGLCVLSAVVLAGHWLALFAAYGRATTGTVILVVYLAPVGVAALAPLVLGEALTRTTLAALLVAAAGFLLVAAPAARTASGSGLVLAIVAAALFVVLVLVSKPLAELYGGLRLAFMEMAGAAIVLAPFALFARWGEPRPAWGWLIVLGVVHTALGTGIYFGVLARVPATHVAILGYLEPVSVVVFGWLFLSESPATGTIAGGALIVLAGILVVRAGRPVATPVEVPAGVPR
jgi:drug/metabolite transporter (DMT)-like permease